MKILIITQYFWPENFRINDLAKELVNRGYKVDVLTGQPNYPDGKFYNGYSFKFSNEIFSGINIIRVPIIPRGTNYFTLSLNYLSYAVFASLYILFNKGKYQNIFSVNYSPVTSLIPAIIGKIKFKIKLFIWVQDLWPESVKAVTKKDYKIVNYLLNKLVKTIYYYSDKILISNKGFEKSITKKEVKKNKIKFMPNWAEDIFDNLDDIDSKKYKSLIPEGFTVMFAGNLGEAQDLPNILKAIDLTEDKINWVFLGSGRKLNWFKKKIDQKKLNHRVKLLGSYPLKEMPHFFYHADLSLVSLTDEYIFSLTMPGKVQSYMASSKPIVSMLNGEGNEIIKKAKCGFCAKSSDFKKLANNINFASNLDKVKLREYGKNSRKYYESNFKKNKIIDDFCKLLN